MIFSKIAHDFPSCSEINLFAMSFPEIRKISLKTCRNFLQQNPNRKLKEFEFSVQFVDSGTNKGPVILAVHGSPGSHNDFRELIPKLAAKNWRILAPNFPGKLSNFV